MLAFCPPPAARTSKYPRTGKGRREKKNLRYPNIPSWPALFSIFLFMFWKRKYSFSSNEIFPLCTRGAWGTRRIKLMKHNSISSYFCSFFHSANSEWGAEGRGKWNYTDWRAFQLFVAGAVWVKEICILNDDNWFFFSRASKKRHNTWITIWLISSLFMCSPFAELNWMK